MAGSTEQPRSEEPKTSLQQHQADDPSSSPLNDEADFAESNLTPLRFWTLSLGLCLGLFLAMLDSSIVATSLFTIGKEFNSLDKINWVALAYTLSYLGCAVLFARVADVIGRRDAFLAAFVLFFGFSMGCGFAQNLTQLIICRALQGVGGSGLYSLTMVIWPELARQDMKQHIGMLAGAVVGLAGVLGPVLGGVLTNNASWRWVFWINGPVGAVSMVIFFLTWPKDEHLPRIERHSWRSLDFFGSFLLVAAAVLVTFSFQNASTNTDQWGHATFIAPVVTGALCWIGLLIWEWAVDRYWKGKMLAAFPMRLLRNRVYLFTLLNTMCLGFPFLMMVYAFPLRLQVVNKQNSLLAGTMLLPMLGGVALGSWLGGIINGARNRIFEALVAASSLVVLGTALETTLSSSVNVEAKAIGFLVVIGLGFGISASNSTLIASIESPISDHAPAQAMIAQIRILGGSLGIAASSAILALQQKNHLAGIVSPQELEHGTASLSPEQGDAVRQTFADAFTKDMTVATAVAGFGLLLTAGTYRRNRLTLAEMHNEQVREEKERRRLSRLSGPEQASV